MEVELENGLGKFLVFVPPLNIDVIQNESVIFLGYVKRTTSIPSRPAVPR